METSSPLLYASRMLLASAFTIVAVTLCPLGISTASCPSSPAVIRSQSVRPSLRSLHIKRTRRITQTSVVSPSTQLRTGSVEPSNYPDASTQKKQSKNEKPDKSKTIPVEIMEEEGDHVFGVTVLLTNLETEKEYRIDSNAGKEPLMLPPGTYEAYTRASRQGFPQEAKYQILRTRGRAVLQEFPRSHVPVTNIRLKKGQRLRVVIPPSIRPYNAIFYRLGNRNTPVAHVVARPYPTMDFQPGQFNGHEQFSSLPIVIAFYGMKGEKLHSELAAEIREQGVIIGERGSKERIFDPVAVLGVREVVRDLANFFVKHRSQHNEDYRGKYHISFLVGRTPRGRIPPSIIRMEKEELKEEFTRRILWMLYHNVHRTYEGGGYAGMTFLEVLEQAKEYMMEWPEVSRQSTELLRGQLREIDQLARTRAPDDEVEWNNDTRTIRSLLNETLQRAIWAIGREKQNYENYEQEWLEPVISNLKISLPARRDELEALEKHLKKRLENLK